MPFLKYISEKAFHIFTTTACLWKQSKLGYSKRNEVSIFPTVTIYKLFVVTIWIGQVEGIINRKWSHLHKQTHRHFGLIIVVG